MNEYKFNIGDEVITADGWCGEIISFCDCSRCEKRGFFEPIVEWQDGSVDWIPDLVRHNNFSNYYKIGDYVFGNIHLEDVKEKIYYLKKKIWQLEDQRDVLLSILERRENNLE